MWNFIFSIATVLCFGGFLVQIDEVKSDTDFSFINETNSTELNAFLDELEIKSGFGKEQHNVTVTCNDETINCTINANGNAVWDARNTLYDSFLLQSVSAGNERQTIDGCLNYTTTVADFQDCMINVRQLMLEKLNSDFDTNLISIIENNSCELFEENCLS